MLQQIRTEGDKPAFFMVHGLHGTVPFTRAMGIAFGRDRPFYALHARGIDGTEPPHERMEDVLRTYLAEIRSARPRGPYIVGATCAGAFLAMDLARTLAAEGERVGSVILVDPPLVPRNRQMLGNLPASPREDRALYRQLYASVELSLRDYASRFSDLPFDANDPAQLHRAIDAGIAMVEMFCRHVPSPFDGPTEFIISEERAFGHFHPEAPWRRIVARPGRIHVFPGKHSEFFYSHLDNVLALIQFALDSAFDD